jgi:hypothetical protein
MFKLRQWDDEFGTREMKANNPFDRFVMLSTGMIALRDNSTCPDPDPIEAAPIERTPKVWTDADANNPNMPPEIREIMERMTRPKDNTPLPPLKVPKPLPVGYPKLYQIKVTLLDVEPPIWRRFVAPSFMSLGHLHTLLQSVMGWKKTHACAFTINGNRFTLHGGFSVDSMWDKDPSYDAEDYELCQLIKPGMTFHYEYDFGDGWEHEIVVENDTVSLNTKH